MQMRRMYDFVDRGRRAAVLRSDAAECARKGFPGLAEANMELAEILSPTPREPADIQSRARPQNKSDYRPRKGSVSGGVANGPVNGGGQSDRGGRGNQATAGGTERGGGRGQSGARTNHPTVGGGGSRTNTGGAWAGNGAPQRFDGKHVERVKQHDATKPNYGMARSYGRVGTPIAYEADRAVKR